MDVCESQIDSPSSDSWAVRTCRLAASMVPQAILAYLTSDRRCGGCRPRSQRGAVTGHACFCSGKALEQHQVRISDCAQSNLHTNLMG